MGKIGRNAPCPCGSGMKYKKCCLPLGQSTGPETTHPATLSRTVSTVQGAAAGRKDTFDTLGVFILFSTARGDAWLLEATEMDAVQIAAGGERLVVEIEEGPETLTVNWSHRFALHDGGLALTGYADQGETLLTDCPTRRIETALNAIHTQVSPARLQSVRLDN